MRKKSQKDVKNEVFGHFIQLGWLDWSDIAYSDSDKWYLTTDSTCGAKKALDLWIMSIIFLVISSSLAGLVSLIMHIVVDKIDT